MALNLPGVPFKLTAADMGVPDVLSALTKGLQAAYTKPNLEQALLKAKQENIWNPKLWQSQIGLQGAEAGLAGAETGKTKIDALMNQLKLHYLQKKFGQNQQNSQEGQPSKNQPQSIYGVEVPKPTADDVTNKMLLDMDTFSQKQSLATNQIKEQRDALLQSSIASNAQLQSLNGFQDLYNEYDQLMEHSLVKGPYVGHIPGTSHVGTGQRIDNLVNQMSLGGIEQMKNVMGNARFAIPEFNVALSMKPQGTWNKATREKYGAFINATKRRVEEISKMKQFVLNHPNLGVSNADLDAIISTYQNNSPITYREGKNRGLINWDNLNNKWQPYLTPDAVSKIKNGKDFKPKNSNNGEKMKKNNWVRDANGKLILS